MEYDHNIYEHQGRRHVRYYDKNNKYISHGRMIHETIPSIGTIISPFLETRGPCLWKVLGVRFPSDDPCMEIQVEELCNCTATIDSKWYDLCSACRKKYLEETKALVDKTEGYFEAISLVYLEKDISDLPFQLRLDMRRDGIITDENNPVITDKGKDFLLAYSL